MKREEPVRQWFMDVLRKECGVPDCMMRAEVGFSLGDKKYRADILLWDRKARPMAIVECKQPEVPITSAVLDQAIRYNMALNLRWIILTNGVTVVVLKKDGNQFTECETLPSYEQMLDE